MAKNEDYPKIGALIKGEDGFYIAVDSEVTLTVNGRKIAPSKNGKIYINMEKPSVKYDRMLAGDYITEEEYDEKVGKIPDYVRQELSVKLE